MKLRKGDQVKIVSGNDKGKQGKILAVFPVREAIVVDGMNIKKKHVRPRKQGQKGELVRIPMPFSASRATAVCSKCGKPTRLGYAFRSGKKVRTCKKCGAEI